MCRERWCTEIIGVWAEGERRSEGEREEVCVSVSGVNEWGAEMCKIRR